MQEVPSASNGVPATGGGGALLTRVVKDPLNPPALNEARGAGFGKPAAPSSVASSTRGSDLDPNRASAQPSLGATTWTVTDMTQLDWTEFQRCAAHTAPFTSA